MKIVLLSHEYPPYLFGGIGIFTQELAKGLARSGWDVTVICGKPMPWKREAPTKNEADEGVTVVRLPYPNLVPRHFAFQFFNKSKIEEKTKNAKPDIIHAQSGQAFPIITSLKRLAPLVITFHGSPAIAKTLSLESIGKGGAWGDLVTNIFGYPAYEFGYRMEFKKADARVAVSESLVQQLCKEMNVTHTSFQIIQNGIDLGALTNQFSNGEFSDSESEEKTLIYGGRLFWSKGVMQLVNLAYLLQNKYKIAVKIAIYGSGPLFNEILRRKNELGLNNLYLKGFTSRSEFISEVEKADFVLLPSQFEAAPMLLLESMCMGKIPVVFNLPYAREFTRDGKYGVLCENVFDMAYRISELVKNKSLSSFRRQIQRFSRENYNIAKTVLAYEKLYESCIENSSNIC